MTSVSDRLWPHQREAVKMCATYLAAFARGETSGSALVRMPTGTGKSGVIAIVAKRVAKSSTCLVVTPWTALRDQIARDIRERFWSQIGAKAPGLEVRCFTPSTSSQVLEGAANKVLVCTHTTLQALHAARATHGCYDQLSKALGAVLVDEGHREPAPSWAQAVRGLGVGCVLFSATPYRNDQKLFEVDDEFSTLLTFQKAVEGRFIRAVDFVEDAPQEDPDAFVSQLMDLVNSRSSDEPPRVIVRCSNHAEVADIAKRLSDAGASALGLHETFSADGDGLMRQKVPNPSDEGAQYWVHQYKLLEGIDDPRFSVLAIFSPLKSGRELVQQIGRVIRNPSRQEGQRALVLAGQGQKDHWQGYLDFESVAESSGGQSPAATLRGYLKDHSRLAYFGGAFRRPFDPDSPELPNELRYRLSANVFDLGDEVAINSIAEQVEKEWLSEDKHILSRTQVDERTVLFTYLVVANSPLLLNRTFFEHRLGYTLVRTAGTHLYVSDSEGTVPEVAREGGSPIDAETLEGLFGAGARVGAVSLINTDVGPQSVRRRTLHARSIDETAPSLFDHSFFPSTATGYTESATDSGRVRRYVGFSRSRVSDAVSGDVSLDALLDWIDRVDEVLVADEGGAPTDTFVRFATQSRAPSDPNPLNILLDLTEVEDRLVFVGGKGPTGAKTVEFDDLCFPVEDGVFHPTVNGLAVGVALAFDARKSRYTLRCEELHELVGVRSPRHGGLEESLVTYLNREQAFRVVVGDGRTIYAHSRFYRPRIPLGGPQRGRLDLLRVLHPVAGLAAIETEKGRHTVGDGEGWEEASVFGLLDRLGEGTELHTHMKDADILVCDDMNKEVADFILGSEARPTIALIHAKAGIGQRRSASVFQELTAQALKNLEYISPYLNRRPPNYERWGKPWRSKGRVVKKRVRKGKDKRDAWDRISRLIRDPSANREVWLVLAGGFEIGAFEKRIAGQAQPPEDVQVLYLLSALWSGVSAVGARLKIFCSP